ncbi:MAG: hypothetical protein ACYCZB_14715, partial [Acidiphilium sp.]
MDGLSMSLPMNRPKGWPLCAGRATGLVYAIYFIIAFEWFVLYGSVFVRFRYQADYFGNIYYGIPLGVVFAYTIALPLTNPLILFDQVLAAIRREWVDTPSGYELECHDGGFGSATWAI